MRTRLFAVIAALVLMLGALPFGASAAAPNLARVSATHYLDTSGNESNSLCGQQLESYIEAVVGYSGLGSLLGGSGTGELEFELYGSNFYFQGELEVDGETAYIEGGGDMFCLNSGYALVDGGFNADGGKILERRSSRVSAQFADGETVCGDLSGYIMDGVHKNQGRISLTLTGGQECEE